MFSSWISFKIQLANKIPEIKGLKSYLFYFPSYKYTFIPLILNMFEKMVDKTMSQLYICNILCSKFNRTRNIPQWCRVYLASMEP